VAISANRARGLNPVVLREPAPMVPPSFVLRAISRAAHKVLDPPAIYVSVNDREFRQRIAELLARQKHEAEEKPAKKPPASGQPKATARRKKA
jgi:hypothetical protein